MKQLHIVNWPYWQHILIVWKQLNTRKTSNPKQSERLYCYAADGTGSSSVLSAALRAWKFTTNCQTNKQVKTTINSWEVAANAIRMLRFELIRKLNTAVQEQPPFFTKTRAKQRELNKESFGACANNEVVLSFRPLYSVDTPFCP